MANFSALKTAIQNAIKQNGNEEITGDVLQQILLSIVSTMGDGAINTIEQNLSNEATTRQGADTQLQNAINAIKANIDNGYVYAGIATPSSTPVSGKVFYIATAAGTYTNFGGQVLTQGINILRFNGSAWSNQQLIGIDDVPTAGSNNLVKSGGVQNELALGAVYDVSAKNPTAGPNNDGKWESLSALLSDANLNTLIPTAYRKGGMSIKFVHTSDNKYVQYRLMSDSFNTTPANWQGVDDVPTAGSNNLVESGGVAKDLDYVNSSISGTVNLSGSSNTGNVQNKAAGNPTPYGTLFLIKNIKLFAGKTYNLTITFDSEVTVNELAIRLYKGQNVNPEKVIENISTQTSITTHTLSFTTVDGDLDYDTIGFYIVLSARTYLDIGVEAVLTASFRSLESQIGLNSNRCGFLTCNTAGNVAAKELTVDDYVLDGKSRYLVRMVNVNTADNVTLNINNTGAKRLIYNGGSDASSTNTWAANELVDIAFYPVYDAYYAYTHIALRQEEGTDSRYGISQKAAIENYSKSYILPSLSDSFDNIQLNNNVITLKKEGFTLFYRGKWYNIKGTNDKAISFGGVTRSFVLLDTTVLDFTNRSEYNWDSINVVIVANDSDIDRYDNRYLILSAWYQGVIQPTGLFAPIFQHNNINAFGNAFGGVVSDINTIKEDLYGETEKETINTSDVTSPSAITPYGTFYVFKNITFVSGHKYRINITPKSSIVLGGHTFIRLYTGEVSTPYLELYTMLSGTTFNSTLQVDFTADNDTLSYNTIGCYIVLANRDYLNIDIDWEFQDITDDLGIKTYTYDMKSIVLDNDVIALNNERETTQCLEQMSYRYGGNANSGQNVEIIPTILACITDLHSNVDNFKRFCDFIRHYNAYIDDSISLGDQIAAYYTDSYSWWDDDNILALVGNHETYGQGFTTQYTEAEVNEKFIAPFISHWNVQNEQGKNYYYKDYHTDNPSYAVRLICLDAMYWDNDQRDWFEATLASAKTNGYAVVVASHYIGGELTLFNCDFTSYEKTPIADYLNSEAAAKVDSFKNDGGEFVCWICGHTHNDFCGVLKDHPDQLVIVEGTAASNYQCRMSTINRIVGTKSQDLFNVIQVNRFTKTVSVLRIGADTDRFLRKFKTLCLSYNNNNVV